MSLHHLVGDSPADPTLNSIIKLACLAVGGQGGGVLTGWIETVARANGYVCQATSVAGVAQRTGATIYYIEMAPASERPPIFSLMPAAGDVDIMISAELMEAGRSILRGFVTPDRTVLISSTHRALAVSEKMEPGDGIASSEEVLAAADIAARRFIAADFDALAIANGSVISASLFGALAGSEILPFPRETFEAAIRAGGKGIEGSLRAFAAGYDAAQNKGAAAESPATTASPQPHGPAKLIAEWNRLAAQVAALPEEVADMALLGLIKVVDYQDLVYGSAYLGKLEAVVAQDGAGKGFALSQQAAKYIANAMCYDDVIRVADLKTRAGRFSRIQTEMGLREGNVLHLTEFMHPRVEEIVGLLPAKWGAKVEASPQWMIRLDRWFNKGRRLRTDGLLAYSMLYVLGGLRSRRLGNLRHAKEMKHLDEWLATAMVYRHQNYELATEVLKCRRLIKGYSDTHSRGLSKFDIVLGGIAMVANRDDAPDWARRLREAALKDEEGNALKGALQTIQTFA